MTNFIFASVSNSEKFCGVKLHIFQNIMAVILLVGFATVTFYIVRHQFWGPRLRGAVRSNILKIALLFAGIFFTVAWLDAISWKDSTKIDGSLNAGRPRTLLDRTFSGCVGMPEWKFKETSFSAPMASKSFKPIADVYDDLKFKGSHLLGTNKAGRDTLYLILKGCKPAVMIGVLPLLLALPLALFFGICAGYFGGVIDEIVVFVYTTVSSIPALLLLIAIVTAFDKGIFQISVGLGVTGWIVLCRLVRSETFKIREMEYIQAARCLGVSNRKIIITHILPNLMHLVLITGILSFTGLVLSESILSYLGVGLDGSWGALIDAARSEVAQDPVIWWNIVFTSTALFMLVLSVNVVGDALRDALDPRTSSE